MFAEREIEDKNHCILAVNHPSGMFISFLLAISSKPEASDRVDGDAVCVEIGMVLMQPSKLELVLHCSTSGWVEMLL